MKIAVINFSGNVGKTTVARHLLHPRIAGSELIAIESVNADGDEGLALRAHQFGQLQEYLQTVENVVVDIGASNVEDLLGLMRRYRGSQEDFDCYVVPTVSAFKQQQDTVATLVELSRLGISPSRVKLVFNMVEEHVDLAESFKLLLEFLTEQPLATLRVDCRLHANEVYERVKGTGADLAAIAQDGTNYKSLIAQAKDTNEKIALAHKLATRRLALGVIPELDACFEALQLEQA